MDEGPFRVSRPAARRAMPQSSPAPRAEEPRQASQRQEPPVEPRPIDRSPASNRRDEDKSKKKPKALVLAIGVALAVLLLVLAFWMFSKPAATGIDAGKYQAVFLTDGSFYMGKLEDNGGSSMVLRDIFYLQRAESPDGDTETDGGRSSQTSTELKRRVDVVHSPEDEMVIFKENILFYENLRSDGQGDRAIEEYKKTSN